MTAVSRHCLRQRIWRRNFSAACRQLEIRDIAELSPRIRPSYQETKHHDLLALHWPSPPRNILLTKKDHAPEVTLAFLEFARHIHTTYPSISIVLEPSAVHATHTELPFPVYADLSSNPQHESAPATPWSNALLHGKVDMVATLGGDGTILRAASLFASAATVPPILSFSMGTLGFLGEWKFREYKRAFREVYMSGAEDHFEAATSVQSDTPGSAAVSKQTSAEWAAMRGKYMGSGRNARVLLRNRLKVGVFSSTGQRILGSAVPSPITSTPSSSSRNTAPSHTGDIYAMNEVILHRGLNPHLTIVEIHIGGRFLTEAVADGIIISTPTGSTAYSLSSGGSIVHPLVSSLLLTPICPRSLSFRPLVLPSNTPITLRLSEKNRGREVDVSVDGMRRPEGLSSGMEIRVVGEDVRAGGSVADGGYDDGKGKWVGGVPSIVRGGGFRLSDGDGALGESGRAWAGAGEDSWVGGLNGLLKFNYPFGEEQDDG